ncbi:MAG TPA: hypothetical protein VLA99_13060, partial [Nitrospiraceae bacterium]|nr:hypothetical protein [Nitrospiraceae bacterium]
TGELFSIFCAESEMKGRTIVLYGDIIFDNTILEKLLKSSADITLIVDLAWQDQQQRGAQPAHINPDLVTLADPPGKSYLSRFVMPEGNHRILKIGQHLPHDQTHGEFIGMAMFSEKGVQAMTGLYRDLLASRAERPFHEAPSLAKASFTDMIQELIDAGHTVQAVPIFKGWMEVDSFEEYQKAWANLRQ